MSELTKEFFEDQVSQLASRDGIRSLESKINEVHQTVQKIDQRDKENSNAFAKDIIQLQRDVKHLKFKHSA